MSSIEIDSSPLALRREIALAVAPHVSGFLSIIGSSTVAIHIIRKRWKNDRWSSYNYIILSISFVDVVSSFAYAMGTWAMPPGPAPRLGRPYRYGAAGNEQTCTAQGFFIQFGLMIIFLNVLLSLHYFSTYSCSILKI